MNIRTIIMTTLLFCLCITGAKQALASVTNEVKSMVDEVVRIVSDKEMKKPQNEQKRRNALKKAISTIFDYGEMTQRSMGKHWKERSPAEKKELVQLFETLLENSYAGKIESYNQEKIVYLKENVESEYADVRSKVITAKRDEFSLDYRLMSKGGRWMVYDVVIEGVSLVSNYRTQFNNIIQRQGYGELVKKLRVKSEEIKAP
ncbi:MlaC/ttg2D family ABC transporter substrate-binding protein [Geotalea uraniireducens]|uniref:Toluene tolerance family protein n=1 Tax=Geotalea uraniireducens (strain Rf4) TaxID=351605 RepID=A5GAZ5_GEOUR|nr:ABC transporter substrate-binding protein [Geotalea uraniireducens]ABQ25249.1 toluene tolerance family protein [Geotalea uraniireducens Rf4]